MVSPEAAALSEEASVVVSVDSAVVSELLSVVEAAVSFEDPQPASAAVIDAAKRVANTFFFIMSSCLKPALPVDFCCGRSFIY